MAEGVIEKIVYELSAEFDPKGFDEAIKTLGVLQAATQNMVRRFMEFSTAMLGATTAENRFTATQAALADSIGVSYDIIEGYSTALAGVGVTYENVTKYMANFDKKSKTVKKALAEMGLGEGADFDTAFSKLLELDGKEASKFASKLFGADAAKALSYAIERGISMADIQEAINNSFLTGDAIEGAKDYNQQISYTYKILRSITKQFAGLLGKYITPLVKKFNEWFRLNKEIISLQIAEAAKTLSDIFGVMLSTVSALVDIFMGLINALGGVGTALNMLMLGGGVLVFAKMLAWVQALTAALPAIKASLIGLGLIGTGPMTIGGLVKFGGMLGAIGLALAALEDIAGWMAGKKSLMGEVTGRTYQEWKEDLDTTIEMFKDGSIWSALVQVLGNFIGWIWEIFPKVFDYMAQKLYEWLGALWDTIVYALKAAWESVDLNPFDNEGWATKLINAGKDMGKGIASGLKNAKESISTVNLSGFSPDVSAIGVPTAPQERQGSIMQNSNNRVDARIYIEGTPDPVAAGNAAVDRLNAVYNDTGGYNR